MIRKFTLLFLACLGCYSLSIAQKCGFDEIENYRLKTDPAYVQALSTFNQMMQNQSSLQSLLVKPTPTDSVYEIPVVVHVMSDHSSGSVGVVSASTLSDAYIQSVISYVNQAFAATWTGYPVDGAGGVNVRLRFVLAKRDPNCNSTNGIVRVNATSLPTYVADGIRGFGSTDPGEDDDNVKALSIWPRDRYYNIWIVNKIEDWDGASGGGTAGFAYTLPAPVDRDGAVILAPYFAPGQKTTVHEIGHSFNLQHTFRHTATGCAPNSAPPACFGNGDFVCDTEPNELPSPTPPGYCPLAPTINTCTGLSFGAVSYNFMNYTTCTNRFTAGQRHRMMSAFFQYRATLVSSLGATAPATAPVTPCAVTGSNSLPTSFYGPQDIVIRRQNADTVFRNNSGWYTADGNNFYIDNTCEQRAELIAGQPYTMRIQLSGLSHRVRVYINYNNNTSFSDPGEAVYANLTGINGAATFTFTPPLSAVSCVPLRMRVMADINAASSLGGPCAAIQQGQVEDYEVVIRGGAGSGGIIPNVVTVSIPSTVGNPSCDSTFMQIKATWPSNITPVWFQWFKKSTSGVVIAGPSGAADSIWTSTGTSLPYPEWEFKDRDTVWVRMAIPGLCGSDTTLDSVVLLRPDKVGPSISITNTAGTIPTCADETVTLGIQSVVNPGGSPAYQWQNWNGVTWVDISGATTSTYNVLGAPNGARYRLRMTSSAGFGCAGNGTVFSNEIQVNHTTKVPTVTIALTTGLNPGCPGQLLTYSVTANTVAGSNPTYQWKVNGVNQSGATGTNFSSVFNAGDVISVEMTSSSACAVPATASSSAPSIQHQTLTADVTIAQISGGNPVCSGHPAVFTATPTNAGTNPQFQWLVNNNPVIGANSPTLNISSLLNNDAVSVILIATDPCVLNAFDTSNYIMMQVTPSKVPKISFTITAGNNPGCLDSLVEFTATTTDAGTTPDIEWLVNGFPLNLNSLVYSTTNLLNNDVVTARVVPTDGQCYLPDTGFSTQLVMVRSVTPEPPIISLINNMLITNKSGSFVWFGPAGQLTGGDDGKFHPTELGKYWAVTNNNGCWSKPSNVLTITLLDINSIDMEPVTIYPNPTSGQLNIEWGRNVSMNISVYTTVGQKMLSENVTNQQRKVIDMSNMANGIYFVVLTDEQGRTSTTRITVTK